MDQAMETLRTIAESTLQQMSQNNVGVPIAFAIVLFLLCWLVIFSRGQWLLKMALVTAVLFFSVSLWHSISSLLGLPSEDQMPVKFAVHWIVVEEPNKVTGDEGGIYIWTKNITPPEDAPEKPDYLMSFQEVDEETPRAHVVPYSRQLHEQSEKAIKMLKQGKAVYGKGEDFDSKKGGKGKSKGKGKGKGFGEPGEGEPGAKQGGQGYSASKAKSMFYELPPPKMPDKKD